MEITIGLGKVCCVIYFIPKPGFCKVAYEKNYVDYILAAPGRDTECFQQWPGLAEARVSLSLPSQGTLVGFPKMGSSGMCQFQDKQIVL